MPRLQPERFPAAHLPRMHNKMRDGTEGCFLYAGIQPYAPMAGRLCQGDEPSRCAYCPEAPRLAVAFHTCGVSLGRQQPAAAAQPLLPPPPFTRV